MTGLPTIGLALTVKLADSWNPAIFTVGFDITVAPIESVTVRAHFFTPAVVYVWVTGFVVPTADPSPKSQLNE